MSETIFPYSTDSVFRSMGVGSLDRAMADMLYGINHMQNPGMYKSNRDQQGYVFCTRPQLNMQLDNIRNYPRLFPLLDENPRSLAKYVRMLLDPRLGTGYTVMRKGQPITIPPTYSALLDNELAFIPVLTNATKTISGWNDEVLQTKESDPGLLKQVFVMPDGSPVMNGSLDLSFSVQNTAGDPLSLILFAWTHYIGAIRMKMMYPYFDNIIHDRCDFHSRTYRIVLNEPKTHVTKIFANVYGFPTSNPTGMFADFNAETPFSEQTKEITFHMKGAGMISYDPRLIYHFNRTVCMFNYAMEDSMRETEMFLLPQQDLRNYNFRAYPRINPSTMAMEWWVSKKYIRATSGTEEVGVGEQFTA